MVVVCPKCRTKLKISDEKVSPDGSRFRCPRCSSVLLVKKPLKKATEINKNLIMVAHSDEAVVEKAANLLRAEGYDVITVRDGIEAMVTALNRLPFIAVIDVALPKIYGFEVCRRLKGRSETEDIGVLLVPSVYDKSKYKRPPSTLYGADDYIEEDEIEENLIRKINNLKKAKATAEEPVSSPLTEKPESPSATKPLPDEGIERARRFIRTVLSDIFIYNPERVNEAVGAGTFSEVFKSQLSEGVKLYQMRISQEVRDKGDFFHEEIEAFMERKKKDLEG